MRIDLDQAAKGLRRDAARALTDAAEHLLEEANRTAPIEEGTLVGSGAVHVDDRALVAAVSYDTPYAVRQHEDTRLRHNRGRRAKWLEHTFREQAHQVGRHMAYAISRRRR